MWLQAWAIRWLDFASPSCPLPLSPSWSLLPYPIPRRGGGPVRQRWESELSDQDVSLRRHPTTLCKCSGGWSDAIAIQLHHCAPSSRPCSSLGTAPASPSLPSALPSLSRPILQRKHASAGGGTELEHATGGWQNSSDPMTSDYGCRCRWANDHSCNRSLLGPQLLTRALVWRAWWRGVLAAQKP